MNLKDKKMITDQDRINQKILEEDSEEEEEIISIIEIIKTGMAEAKDKKEAMIMDTEAVEAEEDMIEIPIETLKIGRK
jgi:hypothetical protein